MNISTILRLAAEIIEMIEHLFTDGDQGGKRPSGGKSGGGNQRKQGK